MNVIDEGTGITIKKERTGGSPPRDEAQGSFLDVVDDKRNPLRKFWKDVFCSHSLFVTFSFALLFQIGKIRPCRKNLHNTPKTWKVTLAIRASIHAITRAIHFFLFWQMGRKPKRLKKLQKMKKMMTTLGRGWRVWGSGPIILTLMRTWPSDTGCLY